jgi:PAS domain S-box-containing protein
MTAETHGAKQSSESLDLRRLIETIPALVVCALPDGSFEFVNRAWQEYTGSSLEQLRNWGWQSAIHPDDIGKFIDEWSADLAAGKPFQTEARIRRADGQYRWFFIRKALAVFPNQGSESSLRTLVACEDINHQKEAQAKLQQSEALLQAFFKHSPNLIFMKDPQGRYLYVNQEVERVLRITEEQIKGKRDDEVFPQEQGPGYQAAAYQANDRQVLQAGTPMEFEEIFVKEDGPHTTIVHKFPLFNAEGAIYAIGGVATDITERKREESARRYSEERHRLVVETANDAIVSMDEDGAIVFANPATAKVFGYDPTELVGKSLTMLMPEYMRQLHNNGFRRYLSTGERHINWQGTELTALHKDGQEFPVEVSFGELTRDGHKVFTGFIRDISERKKAEEALRRSEAYLAQAQRIAHAGSWVWQVAGRKAVYLSAEWYRLYGFDPKDGMPTWEERLERVHPEDRARWQAAIELAIAEKSDYDLEFRILPPGATVRYIRSVGHPVLGPSGELLQFVGVAMDVTERKRNEEALRSSEAYLMEAQRLTHTGSCAVDGNSREILYWSEEMFRLYGFDPQHGLPTWDQWMQRVHPEDHDKFRMAGDRTFLEKVHCDVEFRIVRPDGTVKHIHASGHPVLNSNGELVQVVGTMVDITEHKRAEEERNRLRQLEADLARINRVSTMGELAASIAHEVNQPLTAVTNNSSACLRLLANRSLEPEVLRRALEEIVADGTRASAVIARIRGFIKKAPAENAELDVNEVIQEVLALAGDELHKNQVLVECQLAKTLPLVRADRVQLQQVLLNLIMNGIEAMTTVTNRPRLLRVQSSLDESGNVLVAVHDSGTGLGLEADRVFTPFFTTKANGMGMGLSISRSLVESHGGRLWASPNSPDGAVFYFTLPPAGRESS